MVETRVEDWFVGFEKYMFAYRDGYYRLPYLSNTPEVIVASLQNLPFTNHEPGVIYTQNTYAGCVMHYRQLEEGFWILVANIEFKKNVATQAHYDDGPRDFYFLSHFNFKNRTADSSQNGKNEPTICWSLNKPGSDIKGFFNAGDRGVYINFAFDKNWFARNIATENFAGESSIDEYLASDAGHMNWKNIVPNTEVQVKRILDMLRPENEVRFNILALKMLSLNFILKFFITVSERDAVEHHSNLHEADKKIVRDAEKILTDNLTGSFPGIVAMAKSLNTSPTKLKSAFKATYHVAIYQYYQRKQMEMALELLKVKRTSLKDMALTFGYTNPSKFSSAFKKHHDFLPSEI